MEFHIIYPIEMDEYAWWETEQKGWIEVTIRWASGDRSVTFYDSPRLLESVSSDIAHRGYFTERVVVVHSLTKDALESTVAAMANHDFTECLNVQIVNRVPRLTAPGRALTSASQIRMRDHVDGRHGCAIVAGPSPRTSIQWG